MNFYVLNRKSLAVIVAGMSVTGLSYARIDVIMNIPKKIMPCYEPLTGTVEVRNTGTKSSPVDVMIEWPVAEFECSTVTRVAGEVERTEEGMRWYGFSLKPGERVALGIRSMNMNEKCTKRLTAHATKYSARKTKIRPQELDIFMLDDECCDTSKVGPADPKADFVNVLPTPNYLIYINVLANDGCANPSAATLTITEQPQFGFASVQIIDGATRIGYNKDAIQPSPLPITDTFTYEVCCTGSPESCSEVTVYVTIVDPNSRIGAILQGCANPASAT